MSPQHTCRGSLHIINPQMLFPARSKRLCNLPDLRETGFRVAELAPADRIHLVAGDGGGQDDAELVGGSGHVIGGLVAERNLSSGERDISNRTIVRSRN